MFTRSPQGLLLLLCMFVQVSRQKACNFHSILMNQQSFICTLENVAGGFVHVISHCKPHKRQRFWSWLKMLKGTSDQDIECCHIYYCRFGGWHFCYSQYKPWRHKKICDHHITSLIHIVNLIWGSIIGSKPGFSQVHWRLCWCHGVILKCPSRNWVN